LTVRSIYIRNDEVFDVNDVISNNELQKLRRKGEMHSINGLVIQFI